MPKLDKYHTTDYLVGANQTVVQGQTIENVWDTKGSYSTNIYAAMVLPTIHVIELVVEHSDDNITYTFVPKSDLILTVQNGTADPAVSAELTPTAIGAEAYIGYRGKKRYLRLESSVNPGVGDTEYVTLCEKRYLTSSRKD